MSELHSSLEKSDRSTDTTEEATKDRKDTPEEKSDQTPDENSPDALEKESKNASGSQEKGSSSELLGAVGGNNLEDLPKLPDCETPAEDYQEFPVDRKPKMTLKELLIAKDKLKEYHDGLRQRLKDEIEKGKELLRNRGVDWESYVKREIAKYKQRNSESSSSLSFTDSWEKEYFLPGCFNTVALIQNAHLSRSIVHDDIVEKYKSENVPIEDGLDPKPRNNGTFEGDSPEHVEYVRKRLEKAELTEQFACLAFNYGQSLTTNHILGLQRYLARVLQQTDFERVNIFTREALSRSEASDHSLADAPELPVDAPNEQSQGGKPDKTSSSDNIPRAPASTPTQETLRQLHLDRKDSLASIPPIPRDESPTDKASDEGPPDQPREGLATDKSSGEGLATDKSSSEGLPDDQPRQDSPIDKSAGSGTLEDLTGDEDSNPIEEQKKKLYRPRPTNQDEGNDTSA